MKAIWKCLLITELLVWVARMPIKVPNILITKRQDVRSIWDLIFAPKWVRTSVQLLLVSYLPVVSYGVKAGAMLFSLNIGRPEVKRLQQYTDISMPLFHRRLRRGQMGHSQSSELFLICREGRIFTLVLPKDVTHLYLDVPASTIHLLEIAVHLPV